MKLFTSKPRRPRRIGNPSDNAGEQVKNAMVRPVEMVVSRRKDRLSGTSIFLGAVLSASLLEDAAHRSGDVVREGAKVAHGDRRRPR